ncbi:uncharacterized protein LOC132758491 [Ruditapes philippinarum]|uniref:uncharacterized protein LOC132758491 n=1 Tax=Ruditapes philippinarum TaxID=129788 RepID=UPI00295ABE6F|nr:uncharacterized protein LOC132758491 [Ruditapes philippinarum]
MAIKPNRIHGEYTGILSRRLHFFVNVYGIINEEQAGFKEGNEKKKWASNIKQLLYTNGFGYVWNNQAVDDKKLFLQKVDKNMLWQALLLFGGAKCLVLDNPTITPDFINALANSSFELTCYTRQNASFTQWGTVKRRDKFSLLYYSREGSCTPDGFLEDSQYFETSCYSNGTFKVKIKQVNISYHGQRWYCSYGYGSSNFANITVRVPADHVTIEISSNKNIYITENEMQTVSCNTSACFPKPRVKWYLKNPTNNLTKDITDHSSQSYFFRKDGLISAESILQVLLNRTVNSWHLYCKVWTRAKYADISSRAILLNVAYPPDGPPIIVDNEIGKTVQVIEAESVNLNCTITGGNPLAILRINCFNSSSTTMISTETTVSVYIVWKAIRYLNKCKCESDHIIGGTQITTVRFDVRFPPSIVYFSKLGIKSKRGTFAVERNGEVTIECLAESNPLPDIMLTNQRDEQVAIVENATFLQYSIFKVSCTDAGEYKCSAKNVLTTEHVILSNLFIIVKCNSLLILHLN